MALYSREQLKNVITQLITDEKNERGRLSSRANREGGVGSWERVAFIDGEISALRDVLELLSFDCGKSMEYINNLPEDSYWAKSYRIMNDDGEVTPLQIASIVRNSKRLRNSEKI